MSAQYQALPTDDEREVPTPEELQLAEDPRFNPPTPPAWKRVALILFIVVMFWLSFRLRNPRPVEDAKVVHSNRYSKEHKYRPAASPIITERLKDGRVRVRGAPPTARSKRH
ncbi:hypothetical protein BV25DRAFT_1990574 [Artomyces pyxidatus]|uniref:Uncharacterized protein n=1 Tax=Artomyces pyxidatus TaxID=48021 RepID=A0ACB8T616_9AGAM|nr:hypothetical protein BV25DRAFT_1990574 [Artomyces pyxidatus]